MMVDIQFMVYIILAMLTIGGAIVAFFQMQTRQNMQLDALKKEIEDLKRKQSIATSHNIETEKAIVQINTKLDHIVEAIDELKKEQRCK